MGIDYGIYEISKEGNKYIVAEQLEGRTREFNDLDEVVSYIETELREVDKEVE